MSYERTFRLKMTEININIIYASNQAGIFKTNSKLFDKP